MMQQLVDTYQCEWAAVVRDPEKRKPVPAVRQHRRDGVVHRDRQRARAEPSGRLARRVRFAGAVSHARRSLARRARAAVGVASLGARWAVRPTSRSTAGRRSSTASRRSPCSTSPAAASGTPRRTCARTRRRSCSRAASSATRASEPKVACPLHKKTFSLETGESLQGEEYRIETFPVKVEGERRVRRAAAAGSARPRAGDRDRLLAGDSLCNGHAQREWARRSRRSLAARSACEEADMILLPIVDEVRPTARHATGPALVDAAARRAAVALGGRSVCRWHDE